MPSPKITFDTVRRIALALPLVEEGTTYGSPALTVRGRLLACIPVNKSVEPDSLAICIDFDQRAELMEAAPERYYLTDHYVDYPIVLVRSIQVSRTRWKTSRKFATTVR